MFNGKPATKYAGYSYCNEEPYKQKFTRLRCRNRKLQAGCRCKASIIIMEAPIPMFAIHKVEGHTCKPSTAKQQGMADQEENKENVR